MAYFCWWYVAILPFSKPNNFCTQDFWTRQQVLVRSLVRKMQNELIGGLDKSCDIPWELFNARQFRRTSIILNYFVWLCDLFCFALCLPCLALPCHVVLAKSFRQFRSSLQNFYAIITAKIGPSIIETNRVFYCVFGMSIWVKSAEAAHAICLSKFVPFIFLFLLFPLEHFGTMHVEITFFEL